jgi:hypothetical protein
MILKNIHLSTARGGGPRAVRAFVNLMPFGQKTHNKKMVFHKALILKYLGVTPKWAAPLPIAPTTDVVVHLLQRYI